MTELRQAALEILALTDPKIDPHGFVAPPQARGLDNLGLTKKLYYDYQPDGVLVLYLCQDKTAPRPMKHFAALLNPESYFVDHVRSSKSIERMDRELA